MRWHYDGDVHEALAVALYRHLVQPDKKLRQAELTAVCIDPYHKYGYPLMMKVQDAADLMKLRPWLLLERFADPTDTTDPVLVDPAPPTKKGST